MNTRWLKQNLIVIVFLVIFVALLGVIVWMERKATARKADVEGNLSAQQQELERLQKLEPFPSPENVQSQKRDRDELQKLYQSLQQTVMQSRLEASDVPNEIDFVERLRRTQTELRELAKSHRVEVKEDFAFGFGRYNDIFPCRNPTLRPDECHRVLASLSKQLLVIDKLTRIAISNGVDAITIIRRTEVESSTSASADTFAGSIAEDPKARYQKVPFDFQFACKEGALKAFLNSLSQSDWFFAVETFKFSLEGSSALTTVSSGVDSGIVTPTAGPQQKRLMVTMRIDLVEFPATKLKPAK